MKRKIIAPLTFIALGLFTTVIFFWGGCGSTQEQFVHWITSIMQISPADNATNVSLKPVFRWTTAEAAEGYKVAYGLTVSESSYLNNPVIDIRCTIAVPSYRTTSYSSTESFKQNTTYYWRAIAYAESGGGDYREARQTAIRSFTTGTGPYIITSEAGAHGSIYPLGKTEKEYGTDQTYSITPETHYYVADVLVDGNSVGAVVSYTFSNITASHTISASFTSTTTTSAATTTTSAATTTTSVTTSTTTTSTSTTTSSVTTTTQWYGLYGYVSRGTKESGAFTALAFLSLSSECDPDEGHMNVAASVNMYFSAGQAQGGFLLLTNEANHYFAWARYPVHGRATWMGAYKNLSNIQSVALDAQHPAPEIPVFTLEAM